MADFSPDYAKFTITTSGQQDAFLERRFDRNIAIADLKVSHQICKISVFAVRPLMAYAL